MITPIDARLREDIRNYALKYACEDCIHFEEHGAGCSLGFEPAVHRVRPVEPGGTLVFCKTFELL